jgi:hypothetical protein
MATRKQKLAIQAMSENVGISTGEAMRKAGYSPSSSLQPHRLARSPAFAELAERLMPDKKILKVATAGLTATKKQARIIGRDSKGNPEYEYIDEDDFYARHLYLQTALKIRGLAQTAETPIGDVNIQVINYAEPKSDSELIDVKSSSPA